MKHYIIVKFKEGVEWRKLIPEIKELFSSVCDIDGVESAFHRPSISSLPNRFDYMIELVCRGHGLENFLASDIHREWKARYGELFDKKAIFDCEEDE